MNNREIKFRAWDGTDYMSKPFTLYDVQSGKIQFTRDVILMQYTGLKDKNGIEIYEGDVVKNEWRTVSSGKYFQSDDAYCDHEQILEVRWLAPCFRYFKKNGQQWSLSKTASIEVIGNIYEDSHLLNK